MRHIYPKNVYELRETLFEKVEGFNLSVSEENKLLNNVALLDFESICVIQRNGKKHKLQSGLENNFQFQSLYHRI